MESLRQVGTGILLGIIAILVILGGFSLAMVEGGNMPVAPSISPTPNATFSIVVTIFPTLPLPATDTPENTPQVTVTPASPTATVSLTPLLSVTAAPTLKLCPPPAGWLPVVVQPSDTLTSLALTYHTSVETLRAKNCLLNDQLVAASILYVPPLPTITPGACGAPAYWGRYTVQPGDTLYHLSLLYRVSVQQLMRANCLYSTNISTGQVLRVPNVATSTPGATASALPTSTATATTPASATPTSTSTIEPFVTFTSAPASPSATATDLPTETATPVTPPAAQ